MCFNELDRKKAVGVDGVDKAEYGNDLQGNITRLVEKLKQMSYRPGDIRQVWIPKEGQAGVARSLGISNFEDKLFQRMVHKVLESIYEPLFLNASYGFRPGRSCHDAIKALRHYCYENKVATIIDMDLANYFGTIRHKMLLDILRLKIKDKRFLRYVARLLKAGILSEECRSIPEEGVSQGSGCSPILANVYAHYVLDKWIQDTVKPHCKGHVELFRYGDDAVICCAQEQDAKRILAVLEKRLAKYGLELNKDKTKLVSFTKSKDQRGNFDFLGFTFYWGKSRTGQLLPKVKSSGKRMRSKLKKVNDWAKAVRNKYRLKEIWQRFCVKLAGHIRYYGVSFNMQGIKRFTHRAQRILFKWLNRRSQRKSFTWEKFTLFVKRHPLPRLKIWHPLW
jgi:group II intron reverse transcriptase/maturase